MEGYLVEVARDLWVHKHEFKVEYINMRVMECCHQLISDWTIFETEIEKIVITFRYDNISKNLPLVIR